MDEMNLTDFFPFYNLKRTQIRWKNFKMFIPIKEELSHCYAHKIFCDMKKVIKNDNRITGGVKVFKQKNLCNYFIIKNVINSVVLK